MNKNRGKANTFLATGVPEDNAGQPSEELEFGSLVGMSVAGASALAIPGKIPP